MSPIFLSLTCHNWHYEKKCVFSFLDLDSVGGVSLTFSHLVVLAFMATGRVVSYFINHLHLFLLDK